MDRAWDNQLDTMLDDLQATVHSGSTGPLHSGSVHSSSVHRSSSMQKTSSVNGGTVYNPPGMQLDSPSSQPGTPGHRSRSSFQYSSEWRSNDLGTTDLSSIEKVKSVSKISSSSTNRYEYTTTSSTTQQSIKKNINDLDHLLNNLSQNSSRDVSPSRRPTDSTRGSFHTSRSEERREKLIQNSLSRTPSLNRGQRRNLLSSSSRPTTPVDHNHDPDGFHVPSYTSNPPNHTSMQVNQSSSSYYTSKQSSTAPPSEFHPVHTTPDPLTGRYADGRITPNHGYTRNFSDAGRTSDANGNIPKRPDELLHTLGQNIDQTELEKINQDERVTVEKLNSQARKQSTYMEPIPSKPGPPVYYPTEEMYSTQRVEGGQLYKASAKGSSSKKESSKEGGAAVIPVCLPLCCAAPCVIM